MSYLRPELLHCNAFLSTYVALGLRRLRVVLVSIRILSYSAAEDKGNRAQHLGLLQATEAPGLETVIWCCDGCLVIFAPDLLTCVQSWPSGTC